MILCFDIGNTDIHGGVYDDNGLVFEFRKSNQNRPSADEFGVFVIQILKANEIDPKAILGVAYASVVPDCNRIVSEAVKKYLNLDPLVLKAGVKTGLKIRTNNPNEVGADRIANAIAAVECYPNENIIVVDLGTATTFCAINKKKEYLGGVIATGMNLSMRALAQNTAKLPFVDLHNPKMYLGKTTVESIQIGLYRGHVGLLKEVLSGLKEEAFNGESVVVIGTGGYAHFFEDQGIFKMIIPDLVLQGLISAIHLNQNLKTER